MSSVKVDKGASSLILPRRLAIALLAEAQKAEGAPVHGVITSREGVPEAVKPGGGGSGDIVWARYRSGATEPDAAPGRQLLISIDTKGVLQLRCWEKAGTSPVEREIAIV